MPTEDVDTIRAERSGFPRRGCVWTSPFCAEGSLAGAFSRSLTRRVRRLMLLLAKLGAAITESLDHTNAPRRKGVWQRAATDTNAHRLSVVGGSSASLKLIQVLPYGCTVVLLRNADSLIKHQQAGIFLAGLIFYK